MGSYNRKSIKRKVLRTRSFSKTAEQRVRQNLAAAKKKMLEEFDGHPVTKELLQGTEGTNLTKTLSGYGNLFSFIGFDRHANPIEKVRNFLIQFPRVRSSRFKGDSYHFSVSIPDVADFGLVAAMPWESGLNWVQGVESGISGFGYYMANLFGQNKKSRSGSAIQTDIRIRGGSYRAIPYMSVIIRKLANSILTGR